MQNNAIWQRSIMKLTITSIGEVLSVHLLAAFSSMKYNISLYLSCCVKDLFPEFRRFCVNSQAGE
jgi:hypothetical protein